MLNSLLFSFENDKTDACIKPIYVAALANYYINSFLKADKELKQPPEIKDFSIKRIERPTANFDTIYDLMR